MLVLGGATVNMEGYIFPSIDWDSVGGEYVVFNIFGSSLDHMDKLD